MEKSTTPPSTTPQKKLPFDLWLLGYYILCACILWGLVFYLTGLKWWNHPLTH